MKEFNLMIEEYFTKTRTSDILNRSINFMTDQILIKMFRNQWGRSFVRSFSTSCLSLIVRIFRIAQLDIEMRYANIGRKPLIFSFCNNKNAFYVDITTAHGRLYIRDCIRLCAVRNCFI